MIMKTLKALTIFLLTSILLTSTKTYAAAELAQYFTLDGQLQNTGSATALLDTNAKLTIQILDPSKTCLLYEEQQYVNTATSSGYFSVQVGSATGASKRTGSDPGLSMVQVFQNTTAISAANAPGQTCAGGTYTPSARDIRYHRLIVTPSATNIADTLTPDAVMDSVPTALVAQTVQGYPASQLLILGSGDLTQTNLQTVFATGNAAKLNTLLSVSPTNYVLKDSTSGVMQLPSGSGTPSGVAAGQMWYDSGSLKYYDGSAVKTLNSGTASGTVTSVTGTAPISVATGTSTPVISLTNGTSTGQALRWNGSAWAAGFVSMFDLRSTITGATTFSAGCTAKQTLTWTSATDNLSCTDIAGLDTGAVTTGTFASARMPAFTGDATSTAGTSALTLASSGVTAGTYKSVTVDAKGRVTAGTNPTTTSGYGITDAIKQSGNAFGAIMNIGTTDAYDLTLTTNNSARVTVLSGGNMGVGTASPTAGLHVAKAGAASTPSVKLDGAWYSGGTGVTTKPMLLVEPSTATSAGWSINGTGIGVNAANGFTGNLIDLKFNGSTKFSVDRNGLITGKLAGISSVGDIQFADSQGGLTFEASGGLNWGGFGGPLTVGGNIITSGSVQSSGVVSGQEVDVDNSANSTTSTLLVTNSYNSGTTLTLAADDSAYNTSITSTTRLSINNSGDLTLNPAGRVKAPLLTLDNTSHGSALTGLNINNQYNSGTLLTIVADDSASAGKISTSQSLVLSGTSGVVLQPSSGAVGIGTSSTHSALTVAGIITPDADNTRSLGTSSYRFSAVYAGNGTIQTSDARLKKDIQVSDLGLDFINSLDPVKYHWIKEDGKLHYGFIAQDLERKLGDRNIAMVDHDATSDRYGVIYTELISPIVKAIQELTTWMHREDEEIKLIKSRLDQLEKENKILKQQIETSKKR